MTSDFPIWHPVAGRSGQHEIEVLATTTEQALGQCTAIVETFGYGWYANALPPQGDGASSMLSGMIRGGNFGNELEEARTWCERICGLHPEKPEDRRSQELAP